MPQPLFDVYFRGELLPSADPDVVRERLATLFGLTVKELARLFGSGAVCVKRRVDVDTASQLRARFRDAGALVDIRQTEAPARSTAPPAASPTAPPAPVDAGGAVGLTLAPAQAGSLADCARPVAVTPLPDISHLALSDD